MKMQSTINKARTIPSYFYTCPKHFQEEIKKIFYNNWLHVGRLDQVCNEGDYFSGKIYRQPFVVIKSQDNQVRAYDNVCRHHGTTLTTGSGNLKDRCFECSYHGWTYGLDGRLLRATRLRGIQDFRAKDYGLRAIPLHTIGSMVFLYASTASPDATRSPPSFQMDFDKLTFVKSNTYDLNCNWKVFVDNYLDGGYHVEYAHKQLASNMDMKSYQTMVFDRHSVQSCRSKTHHGKSGNRVGDASTFTWIYPNVMLNRYGKWLDTNTVYPIDVEKCKVIFDYYIERDSIDDAKALENDLTESHRVQVEDELLCRSVQEGMHSQFFTQGRYAPNVETAMYHFHDLLLKDLGMTVPGC